MLPLRRWPPYACAGLALTLATFGLSEAMPPAWRWAPPMYVGCYFLSMLLTEGYLRWLRRDLGLVTCSACQRKTLSVAFEVLGWCLACGHLVTDKPWTARPSRP